MSRYNAVHVRLRSTRLYVLVSLVIPAKSTRSIPVHHAAVNEAFDRDLLFETDDCMVSVYAHLTDINLSAI